jgi:exopolyphosphatase / guanosine-5'-triphosphate,3'-diphosphate pyrophosphatase
VRWTTQALRITAVAAANATSTRLECWGASRKRFLLEEVLERPVEIVAPDGTVVVTSDEDGEAE